MWFALWATRWVSDINFVLVFVLDTESGGVCEHLIFGDQQGGPPRPPKSDYLEPLISVGTEAGPTFDL